MRETFLMFGLFFVLFSVKFAVTSDESRYRGVYTSARNSPTVNYGGARSYQGNVDRRIAKNKYDSIHRGLEKPKYQHANPEYLLVKSKYELAKPKYEIAKPKYHLSKPTYQLSNPTYQLAKPKYQLEKPKYQLANPKYQLANPKYQLAKPKYKLAKPKHNLEPLPSTSDSISLSTFVQEGLRLHNQKRKTRPHYRSELVLDDDLTKGAQKYAELLAKRDNGLQHFGGLAVENLGENLYVGKGRNANIERAVNVWFDEKENGKHCMAHYTQLVWKGSKRLGLGQAKSKRGRNFIVARYFPAGNVWGEKYFRENVHPSFVYPC